MPLPIIRWRKPEKIIFAGIIVFGLANLIVSFLILVGVM